MKIAIVGAGPAGLVCAWKLAEAGHDVTLMERMQHLSGQGSGVLLQPSGLAVLDILGLRAELELLGQKINKIDGRSYPSRRISVAVDYGLLKGIPYAVGVNRASLWTLLYSKAISSGVTLVTDVEITGLRHETNNSVTLVGRESSEYQGFELVVDASGAKSNLLKYAVIPSVSRVLQYGSLWTQVVLPSNSAFNDDCMRLYVDKYNVGLGLLPTGQQELGGDPLMTLFFNLNWRNCPRWNKPVFESWRSNMLLRYPQAEHLIKQIDHHKQLYLAKFMQHTLPKPYGKGIVFIGDAAHASSPQLGQGINMSLIDAVTLPWALEQETDACRAAELYAKVRRNHVMFYQGMACLLTPFYQSDNRAAIVFRDLFYQTLSRLYIMKKTTSYLISGQVNKPLKHLDV